MIANLAAAVKAAKAKSRLRISSRLSPLAARPNELELGRDSLKLLEPRRKPFYSGGFGNLSAAWAEGINSKNGRTLGTLIA
jgi:hypothetical protein